MSDHRMSWVQRLATRGAPSGVISDVEAQSRLWIVECLKCGAERSIWEMGGIRYRAVGNQRNLLKCFRCGRRSWHRTRWTGEGDTPPPPKGTTGWIVRLVLVCLAGSLLLTGAIVALVLWLTGVI
ncbi:MAG: hypothetical protein H7X93_00595 [Sphingomonadaceae bacterium]|nr:hypothetical protein [Sphingomonadaceae bacterium]